MQILWHSDPHGATSAVALVFDVLMAGAPVGFSFAPWSPQRYPAWRFVEGAMSKADGRSRAAKPRTGPKLLRALQRRVAKTVERVVAPPRSARAAGVELA